MVHFSYPANWGTIDLFLMPYHRKRLFPDFNGRLRPPVEINDKNPIYESNAGNNNPDLAIRWSNSIGIFDLGVSHFYGNGREPLLEINGDNSIYQTFYPLINQTGIDVQATLNAFLLKFEGIHRVSDQQEFSAIATGVEYTIGNIGNTGLDIGLIAEYLYDSRGEQSFSSMDNDLFTGARFALNDTQSTELLAGGIFDLKKSTKLFFVEGSRRFGNSVKINIEGRFFQKIDNREFLYFIRRDSFLQLSVAKYF